MFSFGEGDEIFIQKWLVHGKLNIKIKDLFLWIEKKYFKNQKNLKKQDIIKFEEISDRFFINNWRIIILLSEYQMKFRYYSKVIDNIKNKNFPEMGSNQFLKIFEKDDKQF
tara:strand:- start:4510 stop:4842 length:333 start_codon:yes stop_codon:yes gene_type:complete